MISKKICIFQPTSSLIQQSVFDKYAMANMKLDAVYFKGEDGEFHLLGFADQILEESKGGAMINGFSSIHAYEQACANIGFTTRKEKFVKDGEQFFALIITPPKTASSISSWILFSKDEAVIDGGIINGIDANYLGKLKAAGYVKI